MPTYHRSQRLRLVGTGPKVEQLQEGRFRLTFTCTATNPNEAWMNGNKDQIITAYGTLQSAQKNISGIDPRTDEAYSDMVLFRTEANPSERDLIITLVYETATTSFVKSQDDKIDFELNGLQRVTRVTIAKTGTTLPSVTVGETLIGVNGISCKLASRSVEENDAFIQITETYLQSGITDVREDIIGSQKAIVITKVGNVPTASEAASKSDIAYDASDDWSIARKDVAQEGGLKIYTYTFLLDNTVLSQSQDKQSSLKTEVIEVFNPKVTIDGLTVEGGSTVAGNYFLSVSQGNGRNQYFQSQGDVYPKTISYDGNSWRIAQYSEVYATSTDTNPDNSEDPPSTGWSGTGDNEVTQITIREFDQTLPNSTSGFELSHRYDKEGYSLINIQRSNLDGIPTMRYTFAKDNVLISQSEEKVGSQLAIVKEVFNGTPSTPSGYSIADESVSSVDGIPTKQFRFLKNDVQLSLSVDNQSPLKTEVQEWFNPESDNDRDSKTNYSLINEQQSNVEGIPTVRYTFAKNNVLLSVTEDKVGSQNAIVNEIFNPVSESITGVDSDNVALSGYSEIDRTESNHDGIKTIRVRFLKNNVQLSKSVDNRSPLLTETREYFKPDASKETLSGYSLINKQESNVDGIPTERYTFAKNNVEISKSEDNIGSQLAIVRTFFNPSSDPTESGYVVAKKDQSDFEGIKTIQYTFLKENVQLSKSVDNESAIKTETREYFKPDSSKETLANYSLINKSESDVDGIPTERYVFAKDNQQISKSVDNQSALKTETIEYFNPDASRETLANYSLINKSESNVDGIPTERYTFAKDNQQISKIVDNESPLKTEIREYFNPDSSKQSLSGYSLVNKQESNVDGIPTERYTFAKNNVVLSVTQDNIGSQLAIVNEVFNPTDTDTGTAELDVASEDEDGNALTGYVEADRSISSVDGIQTVRIRYLKENVQLSRSVDNESPLLTEVREYFKPDASKESLSGYSLVNKQESNIDGVPTERYTFSKNNVTLSVSEEKVGSQNAVVNEIFNPTSESITGVDTDNLALSGYSEADRTESNYDGIKTIRVRFLKENVQLSKSVDNESPLKTEVREYFKPDSSKETLANYSLVNKQESNVDGIPTERYTFAKDNVQISRSVDNESPLKTETREYFNPDSSKQTLANYTLINKQESNVDGIPTERYTFAKNNVLLSVSEEKVGSQNAIVNEIFKPINENSISCKNVDGNTIGTHIEADRTESNHDGIKTIRVRFLKHNAILSTSEDLIGSQKAIIIEKFGSTAPALTDEDVNGIDLTDDYIIANKQESSVDGIKTFRYTFLKEDTVLSKSTDNESPLLTEVLEVFEPDSSRANKDDYVLTNKTESNVNGIPTERYTFKKTDVILSQSHELVGSQEAVVISKFGSEPTVGEANTFGGNNYTIAKKEESGTTNQKTFTYTFLQNNVTLSISEDLIGSQKAIVIEKFGDTEPFVDDDPNTSGDQVEGVDFTGYSIAKRDKSNLDGIETYRYTYLKDDVVLSRSRDSVGSQKAVVLEVFNGDNEVGDANTYGDGTSYVLAREEESSVDGVKTKRYTYLQPSILSRTDDKQNPACPITIVAFDKDENDSGIFASENAEVDSDIYVLVSKTERDFEGIETFEMRFEKILYFLSERKNEFGRIENVLVEQGGSYSLSLMPGSGVSVNGTSNSYIIAQEITEGTVPRKTTTYSTAGIESVSEDLVGATKVITITSFITAPTTTDAATYSNDGLDAASDFVLISDTNNRVNGVDIFTYRFARKNAIVSTSFDAVGSQKAFVVEKFGDTAPSTDNTINSVDLSAYTLAKSDESNVDGIKTFRYTFLKDNVILSVSEDLVGSQKAVIIEKFGSDEPALDEDDEIAGIDLGDHVLARSDKSNFEGIKTFRYTYLKPSIISVAQDFVEDINTIQVTAFDKTESEVKTDLSEVTDNHKLISQRENNHDGIVTTTYTFQINTSDIIEFTADDRLQVTRTIYEVSNYDYDSNYTVGTSIATVNNTALALTSLRVDQRGTTGSFTKLTAVYTQPKIVTVSPIMTSEYNDVPMYQYRSIVSSPKAINTTLSALDPAQRLDDPNGDDLNANAIFFEPTVNNTTSPSTFTQNVLNTSTDLSVANSSVLISSHDDLYNFLYPGVVRLDSRIFGPYVSNEFNRIEIKTTKESHPITTKVRCQVYNFIQRNGDIEDTDFTYDGAVGLWSPNSWATVDANIIKNYFGFSQEPNQLNNVYTGYRLNGSSLRGTLAQLVDGLIYYNAAVIYNGVNYGYDAQGYFYEIKVTEPGPPDPVGKKWCLGVDIKPVFRDTSGNTYYNKQIIVTEIIPLQERGQLTYS